MAVSTTGLGPIAMDVVRAGEQLAPTKPRAKAAIPAHGTLTLTRTRPPILAGTGSPAREAWRRRVHGLPTGGVFHKRTSTRGLR